MTNFWKHKGIILVFLIGLIMLGSLSVLRYEGYNAAILDLGYMSQAIWSASQGDLLLVSYPQGIQSRITGHSEIIFFIIAIFYKLFPDPKTLLILQAFLYASAVIPLYTLALGKFEEKKYAIWISLIYLLYPVAMTAVLFDFHGDTLAMPLFFFAFYFLEKKRMIPYSIVVLLILSCKIYIVLPVLVFGIILFVMKKYKAGLITVFLAFAWYASLNAFRAHYFGGGAVENAGMQAAGYATSYFGNFLSVIWRDIDYRILNGLVVFLPIIFLGLKASLWLMPGLGLAGGVLLSSGPGPGYDYRFHHYAVAVPFFIMAILEGARKSKQGKSKKLIPYKFTQQRSWKIDLKATLILTVVLNFLLVQTPFSPQFYLFPYQGSAEKPFSSLNWRDQLKDMITNEIISPKKGVMADIFLAPHMANRSYLYSTHYTDTDGEGTIDQSQLDRIYSEIDYVILDFYSVYFDMNAVKGILDQEDFRLVFNLEGLLVFSKTQTGQALSSFEVLDWTEPKCIEDPINSIMLCNGEIAALEKNQYQVKVKWALVDDEIDRDNFVAITKFVGPGQVSIIHVSALEVLSKNLWEENQTLEEVLYVDIPESVPRGKYQVYTAWYDASNPVFPDLGSEARVNDEVLLGIITIE